MVRNMNKTWNTTGGQILDAFCREMDQFVGRMQDSETWTDEVSAFSPRTNVAETPTSYEISLDMPGMKAEDFNIELHEGRLTISGERTREEAVEEKTFHRVERHYGKFRRTFTLGPDVDVDSVSADYSDGVLLVVIPKTEKAQPKRIHVKS